MKVFIINFFNSMFFLEKGAKNILLAVFLASIIFLGPTLTAEAKEGKHIDVNLSAQTMKLYDGKKVVGTYKISSGKKSTPTPKGTFQVHNKAARAWSAEYKLFMPYWMAFTSDGGYGIHELPEWKNGTKEGAAHLGVPVSHGCVRLGVGAAKAVYNWAPVGTPVVIR
jgi:lipoprotein-anchoring transpeptidase ErfK/SrfK